MCGIFGAIGSIDESVLSEVIEQAARRGPQAYGLAWVDAAGELRTDKRIGRICAGSCLKGIISSAVIGNCRLGTSGTYREMENNQPIAVGRLAVSHNGNIRGYLQIAKKYRIKLAGQCDSEVIAHLVKRYGIEKALDILSDEMPMALLLLQNKQITAFRKGLPLYHLAAGRGNYFCSRPFRDAAQIPEGSVFVFEGGANGATDAENK